MDDTSRAGELHKDFQVAYILDPICRAQCRQDIWVKGGDKNIFRVSDIFLDEVFPASKGSEFAVNTRDFSNEVVAVQKSEYLLDDFGREVVPGSHRAQVG